MKTVVVLVLMMLSAVVGAVVYAKARAALAYLRSLVGAVD